MTAVFKVKDGAAHYSVQPLTEQQAEDLGCPGANVTLHGKHAQLVGTLTPATGREVRVMAAGWYSQRGQLATFVPWNGQGESFRGWIVGQVGAADPAADAAVAGHPLVGKQVVSRHPVVNPAPKRKKVTGQLVRTFAVGCLTYGEVVQANGVHASALLRDIEAAA